MIQRAVPEDWEHILVVDCASSPQRTDVLAQALQQGEIWVQRETSGGEIRGFALLHHHFFSFGFVELLVVGKPWRRKGIGLALLKHCGAVCATSKLFTSTNQSNLPMQALLKKAGFVPCGQIDALDEGDPELFYVSR